MREATRRDGIPVIIKRVKHGAEVDILKYLGSHGGVSNHIIELLDVLDFDVHWLIIMPDYTPLRQCSHRLSEARTVYSLQKQFLEGVIFLHTKGVAHLDLKPDNVVIDFGQKSKGRNQGALYIIDFGIAEMDVVISTVMEDVCGTRGWTAPEVQEGRRWSPLMADRWACGRMLLYLGEQIKWTSRVQDLVRKLMEDDPQARPSLEVILEGFAPSERHIGNVGYQDVHVPTPARRLVTTH